VPEDHAGFAVPGSTQAGSIIPVTLKRDSVPSTNVSFHSIGVIRDTEFAAVLRYSFAGRLLDRKVNKWAICELDNERLSRSQRRFGST
jgi:hypothetical protein